MIVGRTVNYRRVKNPIALHRARVADPLRALIASLYGDGQQGAMFIPQPVVLGQQVLFQDAAGTTPVTADGDPVGRMLDISGRGNHASQNVSGERPISPGLYYDGVDDWQSVPIAALQGGTGRTIVAAVRWNSLGTSRRNASILGIRSPYQRGFCLHSGSLSFDGLDSEGNSVSFSASGDFPRQSWAIASLTFDNDEKIVRLRLNGAVVASLSIQNTLAEPTENDLRIGFVLSSPTHNWLGDIGPMFISPDSIPAEKRQEVESYFASLVGVTL